MDHKRFGALVRSLSSQTSRRIAMGSVGGLSLAGLLGAAEVEAKRKKKKKKCPKPPPPHFCAGKNACVVDETLCHASGDRCFCFIRADAGHIGEPFCGSSIIENGGDCSECSSGLICVHGGGDLCGCSFGCVAPCPDPL